MHKDELIQLHTLLCQMKNYFEETAAEAAADEHLFEEYSQFGVSPQHIHKSKTQHKAAVFLLGKELASIVSVNRNTENAQRIVARLDQLAERAAGGVEKKLRAPDLAPPVATMHS